MASVIKIKKSGTTVAPNTLASGELAYSWASNKLYIGYGSETTPGEADNIAAIGGKFYTDYLSHVPGTLTASSAIIVDSNSKIDNLLIDNLQLNGNTFSSTDTNGNIVITPNGTGKTVISNPYIGDINTSLTEFIQDVTGGQIIDSSEIDATYDDNAGTTSLSLISGSIGNSKLTNSTITIAADTGTSDPVSLGETLSITGDTGITTTVSANQVSIDLDNTAVTPGSYGSSSSIPTFTVDAQGRLTAASTVNVATTLSIAGDTGTDGVSLLTDTLTVAGGEGIDVAVTNNTITISGENASTANKGVASFNSADFSVTAGAVSISNVNLGTQTTGNYVATIAGTANQVSVSGSGTETAAVTLSLPQNIHTGATPTFGGMSLTGSLALGSNRITGLADPVDAQDAATKYYVDAARSGLDVKQSVRAATTANITLSGTQTIDGVVLAVGDRVLVKDQTIASQNGIYVVAASAWSRASDADEPNEVSPGLFLFVEEGTLNSDNGYVITSDAPLTVGSDALVFTQFSGAGMIIAGAALTKTGNTLDVQVAASGGIEIVSDALQLKSSVAGAGLTHTSGVLNVGGTTNRITVNADSVDIASTYAGQASIVTLGTITTGTWNASTVAVPYGGTGLTSVTARGLLYGNGTSPLGITAGSTVNGSILYQDSTGNPYWSNTVDGGSF